MTDVTYFPLKHVATVTALSRFSGYSRMQIYRLLKSGAFSLGTLGCYRWAKAARTRTGADIAPQDRAARYQQLLDLKFPHGPHHVRRPAGLPRLNSRLLREPQAKTLKEIARIRAESPEYERRQKEQLARLTETMNKRPISTLRLAAEQLSDPMRPGDDSFNPGDRRRAAVAERLAEEGAARADGIRWSRKRVPFDKIQVIAIELAARDTFISYRALAEALGVHVATLYRWRKVGHLKQFAHQLTLSGYGATVQQVVNRGKKTPERGGETPRRPIQRP